MSFRGGFRGRGFGPGMGFGPGPRGPFIGLRGPVGPRGPMGPVGPMRRGGPRGGPGNDGPPRPYNRGGSGRPRKDELKQNQIYLETMKKNMPTNQDTLALYCPACSYTAKNNMDFLNHHKSFHHKNQMSKVDQMPKDIKEQVYAACEKILTQRNSQKSLMFCEICDIDLTVPYSDHKNLEIHKIRSNTLKVGCLVCDVKTFKNFPEYKAHCKSEEHVEKAESQRLKYDEQIEKCTALKDFPPHKDGIPYGQKHVIHVEGSFCNVCKRFFYEEEEAVAHTSHKSHYNHVRDLFFNKRNKDPVDMGDYPEPEKLPEKMEECEITISLEDM